MTNNLDCNEHNWAYSHDDYVRECKNCHKRWVMTWVEIPPGAIVK